MKQLKQADFEALTHREIREMIAAEVGIAFDGEKAQTISKPESRAILEELRQRDEGGNQ